MLGNLINQLPEYRFKTTGVDIDEKALSKNISAQEKLVSDLSNLDKVGDKSIDVAIMRYVLHLNNLERQKAIIKEVARIIKKFAIIQHAGADNENPKAYREKVHDLYSGKEVPKIKREEYYYSSANELEQWMKDDNISFERLEDKKINNIFSNVFAERFNLNKEEIEKILEVLGDKNYLIRTTWLIYPQDKKIKPKIKI